MKIRSIRLGFAPGQGSRRFDPKMEEIYKFEDIITIKYQNKNDIRNNNSLNKFVKIGLDSNSLLNKSLEECRLLKKSAKTPMHEIEDVQDMEAKVNHGDLFLKFYNRNDKQVTGAESKLIDIFNDNYNSLLFSLDSSCNNRYKNYYYTWYICKYLLPFQIPVTDILICVGVVLYRDNIISHKSDSSDFETLI